MSGYFELNLNSNGVAEPVWETKYTEAASKARVSVLCDFVLLKCIEN